MGVTLTPSGAPTWPTETKELKADERTKLNKGHHVGDHLNPGVLWGSPFNIAFLSEWNRTKISQMEPACRVPSVPIDVEPRNPSGERLRTKTKPRAHLELTPSKAYRTLT